jgi:uncharacterized membrane protein
MTRILSAAALAAVAGLGLVGCDKGTPGGPGATGTGNHSVTTAVSTAEDTFTLSTPTLSTHLKQGESKVVTIGIKRGKNFGQDVSLKLDGLPKGVTAEPSAPSIKAGDEDAKVTFKAADDAALGDFTVKITGHPGKGADASNDLKLTVEKK